MSGIRSCAPQSSVASAAGGCLGDRRAAREALGFRAEAGIREQAAADFHRAASDIADGARGLARRLGAEGPATRRADALEVRRQGDRSFGSGTRRLAVLAGRKDELRVLAVRRHAMRIDQPVNWGWASDRAEERPYPALRRWWRERKIDLLV